MFKIFDETVRRRYNHFDWLHDRLTEKFFNICIPPLSRKAVTNNFDENFINKRKVKLELWLNRMAAHPVIGQSEVFIHFLRCEEDTSKWKAGKRKAENDQLRGGQWICTLNAPKEPVDARANIKDRIDKFSKAIYCLKNSFKNASHVLEKLNENSIFIKKEYNSLGNAFEEMSVTLRNESLNAVNSIEISNATRSVADTFRLIGNIHGDQAQHDTYPLLERFKMYQGIMSEMCNIAQNEKSANSIFEDFQSRPEKLEGRSLTDVTSRREVISHITFAEINQFNKEKVHDLSAYMKSFLGEQIKFYMKITECLKKIYSEFEKLPE